MYFLINKTHILIVKKFKKTKFVIEKHLYL